MKKIRKILLAIVVLTAIGSALALKIKTNPNVSRCSNFQCELRNYSDFPSNPGDNPVNPNFVPYLGVGPCEVEGATCFAYYGNVYLNN